MAKDHSVILQKLLILVQLIKQRDMNNNFDKLFYTRWEIVGIYVEALEQETGSPVPNLADVMDYESYKIEFDSATNKVILFIQNVNIQFEMENETVCCVNYMDGKGWFIGY